MTNAARHSRGTCCMVTITATQQEVELLVEDDGVGPDPARPAHVGLGSMADRAAEIGGRCTVLPRPGGGTVVRATLPLGGGAPS
jgi:signal transduction histidine kinase